MDRWPIAFTVSASPMRDRWLPVALEVTGGRIVEIDDDDPDSLPADCAGVIGHSCWKIYDHCIANDIPVRMYDLLPSGVGEQEWDYDQDPPGVRTVPPNTPREDRDRQFTEDLERLVARRWRFMLAARARETGQPAPGVAAPAVAHGVSGRRYWSGALLGAGGTAVVVRATDDDGQQVAVKWLSEHRFASEQTGARLRRELELLQRVEHPNVVRVVDQIEDQAGIVLELLNGGSLHSALSRQPHDIAEGVAWMQQALRGLAAMHGAGLVHRDLSPKNLMFREPGGDLVVTDLGTARHVDDETITGPSDHLGSLLYIPPEQFDDVHAATPASDVYAMGQIAFRVFSGLITIGNPGALHTFVDGFPPELGEVVEQMRAHRIDRRPATAGEALTLLDEAWKAWRGRIEPPQPPPWRPVINAFEHAYGTLERACTVQPEDSDYHVGSGVADDIQRQVWAAAETSARAVERHVATGGALTAADVAKHPIETWPVLLGPEIESYAQVSESGIDVDSAVAFTRGTNDLVRLLLAHRRALEDGSVVLVLAECVHEVDGPTGGGGARRLDGATAAEAVRNAYAAPMIGGDDRRAVEH